jgi:hypothetical protein
VVNIFIALLNSGDSEGYGAKTSCPFCEDSCRDRGGKAETKIKKKRRTRKYVPPAELYSSSAIFLVLTLTEEMLLSWRNRSCRI